ncbi:hypothetical protein GW17_00038509 [Ensete ventricosum]|nr:hypothetical protein GW17_00038509 [Ensete ventricosum]
MRFFSKGKQVILRGKRGSEATTIAAQRLEKVPQKESNGFSIQIQELQEMKQKEIEDMNRLPQLVEISGASTKPSRLHPIRLPDPPTLNWPKEPPADTRPNCCLHPQKTEGKRITQEMTKTRITRSRFFPVTTLNPYIFVSKDKLFLKCNIPPKPPWFLMRHSQISGDFHDFPQERTMILKVFSDHDLRSTAHDRKKIESLQWQNQSKRGFICRTQRNMNITPLTVKKDAPPWPCETIGLAATMPFTSTLDCG